MASTSKESDEKSSKSSQRSAKSASVGLEVDDIKELLALLSDNDVREFELERGDDRLWLRRGEEPVLQTVLPASAPVQAAAPQPVAAPAAQPVAAERPATRAPSANGVAAPAAEAPAASNLKNVVSPMVGTFYRRPSPDADAFVSVGDVVKEGHVLCIVEAMKIMNEIQAEIPGRIAEVLLDDGQMAEYGEVLFRIEPV